MDQYRKELKPSHALIATGCSGILYPPHCLDKRAFNVETIKKYCFEADDIWLKCMALLNDTKYVWVKSSIVEFPEIEAGQQSALSKTNVIENRNNFYLNQVIRHYHIDVNKFFD